MMSAREDRRLLKVSIAFVVGLAAIGIVVANIRYLDLGEGSPGAGPELGEIASSIMYAMVVIWISVFAIYLFRRKPNPRTQQASERRKSSFLATLLIVGVLILAVFAVDQSHNPSPDEPSPDPGAIPDDVDNNPVTGDTSGGMGALFILIGVLVIALAVAALRHDRSTPLRLRQAQLALAQENATETMRQAAMDLFAGEDPRSVIVRTYQQMSRLLGKEERSIKPLTPREVAELAERDFGWPDGPLTELTSLFEEAWYSRHAMGEPERDRALRAFKALVSERRGRRPEIERTNT